MFRISLALVLLPLLVALLLQPLESNNVFLNPEPHCDTLSPRILLVTAHPDDESFFFAPTILSLLNHAHRAVGDELDLPPPPEFYVLCLSSGDADGLGKTRLEEFQRSLDHLGVQEGRRWIVDSSDLKDNITATWDVEPIADTVRTYIVQHNITTILTFDNQGITSHPNHMSIPYGILHLLSSLTPDTQPKLYTLISLPIIQKYIGPFAVLLAKFDLALISLLRRVHIDLRQDIPVFVSGVFEYLSTVNAVREHDSQLIWFRWLNILFSRYFWVNEWVEVKPQDV